MSISGLLKYLQTGAVSEFPVSACGTSALEGSPQLLAARALPGLGLPGEEHQTRADGELGLCPPF